LDAAFVFVFFCLVLVGFFAVREPLFERFTVFDPAVLFVVGLTDFFTLDFFFTGAFSLSTWPGYME
jgi:hypothetical protein